MKALEIIGLIVSVIGFLYFALTIFVYGFDLIWTIVLIVFLYYAFFFIKAVKK